MDKAINRILAQQPEKFTTFSAARERCQYLKIGGTFKNAKIVPINDGIFKYMIVKSV